MSSKLNNNEIDNAINEFEGIEEEKEEIQNKLN